MPIDECQHIIHQVNTSVMKQDIVACISVGLREMVTRPREAGIDVTLGTIASDTAESAIIYIAPAISLELHTLDN